MREDYQAVLDAAGHGKKVIPASRPRRRSGAARAGGAPALAALQVGLRDGVEGLVRVDREGRATAGLRAASTPTRMRCCATTSGTSRTALSSRQPPASPTACPGSRARSGWSRRCTDKGRQGIGATSRVLVLRYPFVRPATN